MEDKQSLLIPPFSEPRPGEPKTKDRTRTPYALISTIASLRCTDNLRRNQLERKASLPHVAHTLLLYPSQSLDASSTPLSLLEHIAGAVVVYTAHGTPKLDRGFDETGEPEDEHDEGEEEDVEWQEDVVVVEDDNYGDVDEGYDGD